MPESKFGFWQLRFAAFIFGVSTLMHIATTVFRLESWWRWAFAILIPTAGITVWHVVAVNLGHQHPGSIGIYGFLAGGLFWFPLGYAAINGIFIAVSHGQNSDDAEHI